MDRDGARVRFVTWGSRAGGLPLLALHGLSSNALFWSRIAARLPDIQVIAPDQRAHGRTGAAPGYAPADYVADAVAVLDRLAVPRAVVIGHSWGASVALAVAAGLPERVAALIFADGGMWPRGGSFDDFAQRVQPAFARWPSIDGAVEELRADLGHAWGDDLVPFAHNGVTQHPDGWGSVLTHDVRAVILRGFFDLGADRLWSRVTQPALVAVAGHKPPEWLARTRASLELVRAAAPHVLEKWYDSPHDIPLYLADEFAADVRRVIAAAA